MFLVEPRVSQIHQSQCDRSMRRGDETAEWEVTTFRLLFSPPLRFVRLLEWLNWYDAKLPEDQDDIVTQHPRNESYPLSETSISKDHLVFSNCPLEVLSRSCIWASVPTKWSSHSIDLWWNKNVVRSRVSRRRTLTRVLHWMHRTFHAVSQWKWQYLSFFKVW